MLYEKIFDLDDDGTSTSSQRSFCYNTEGKQLSNTTTSMRRNSHMFIDTTSTTTATFSPTRRNSSLYMEPGSPAPTPGVRSLLSVQREQSSSDLHTGYMII